MYIYIYISLNGNKKHHAPERLRNLFIRASEQSSILCYYQLPVSFTEALHTHTQNIEGTQTHTFYERGGEGGSCVFTGQPWIICCVSSITLSLSELRFN